MGTSTEGGGHVRRYGWRYVHPLPPQRRGGSGIYPVTLPVRKGHPRLSRKRQHARRVRWEGRGAVQAPPPLGGGSPPPQVFSTFPSNPARPAIRASSHAQRGGRGRGRGGITNKPSFLGLEGGRDFGHMDPRQQPSVQSNSFSYVVAVWVTVV